MNKIHVSLPLSLILFCGLLTACGGTASTSLEGEVETKVAATYQAMGDTQTGLFAPTLLPTAMPAQVLPQGSFSPPGADQCNQMKAMIEQAIGLPAMIEVVDFSDRVTGGTGTACRIHISGDGTSLEMGAFTILDTLVREGGWSWDSNYSAAGPTGMMEGYRKGGALGLLSVTWQPSSNDLCPKDQSISACDLTPEQKLFDVTFDIAQVVVYIPLSADQCAAWLTTLQPAIRVSLVQETVTFNDLEGNYGTACQVHGAGTGLDFSNFTDTADTIGSIFGSLGWTAANTADGPTGTMREYSSGNQTGVVTITWQPSADANCPTDQPISTCNLTAEQRLYTLTVAFAQK
jgi:hypothetical protein